MRIAGKHCQSIGHRMVGSGVCSGHRVLKAGAVALGLALMAAPIGVSAQDAGSAATPIKEKNIGVSRVRATPLPRSEGDQAVVDGWPLYRTERGQESFNAAMATVKATDGAAPPKAAFKGCVDLHCNLDLPRAGDDGWLPAGRLWVSPTEYVMIAHSPRLKPGQQYRRRPVMGMRYFVYHEYHNSSRNTDTYDTISSHSRQVFVPFYLSKTQMDAKGRSFVVVVQVAPYDVVSIHASDKGSAGPGVEVAKNVSETLEPLQAKAGVLLATITKAATPRLQVVNHRGTEGLPMLKAYNDRIAALRAREAEAPVALPFVAVDPRRVASVAGHVDDVILGKGKSPPIAVAERAIVPRRAVVEATPALQAPPVRVRMAALTPRADVPTPVLVSGPILLRGPGLLPRQPVAEAQVPAEPQLRVQPTACAGLSCLRQGVGK